MKSETIKELENILNQIGSNALEEDWKSDADWTRAIKNRIGALGKDKRYWVYASSADNVDGGEWLYDLTWLNYSDDDLLCVELALESEWLFNEIDHDFQKLLVGRAELRVFIFQAKTEEVALEQIKYLKRQIVRFTKSEEGDSYLFSSWLIG